jgi:uncharacterized membrane protein YphA (DoxX/SURF4 family)
MAFDRQGGGLTVVRVALGVFFLAEGLGKVRWVIDPAPLGAQLAGWQRALPPWSLSAAYLEKFAIPGAAVFARLVPIGEISSGLALILGLWTPVFACLAFLLALNFQFASGALFKYSFLSSGYGLPVLGSTLGLTIGGIRLPWSIR